MMSAPARTEWFVWDEGPERECFTERALDAPELERELIHEDAAAETPRFTLCSWHPEVEPEAHSQPAPRIQQAAPSQNFRVEAPSLIEMLISYFFLFGDGRHPAHGHGKSSTNRSLFRSREKGSRLGSRLKFRGFNFVRLEAFPAGFLAIQPFPRLTSP